MDFVVNANPGIDSELNDALLHQARNAEQDPPLGLQTFIYNHNRFVARQTPLILIRETITNLVGWKDITKTLAFLSVYALLCKHSLILGLYPKFILLLPQFIVLCLISSRYQHREEAIRQGLPLPKPHPFGDTPQIAPTLGEILVSVQNIQNTMGVLNAFFDTFYDFYKLIDWSDPELTRIIMLRAIGAFFVALMSVLFFNRLPLNLLFLVLGIGLFIATNPHIKALNVIIPSRLLGFGLRILGRTRPVDVIVFENQTWSLMRGFRGSKDNKPWSDELGTLEMGVKDNYTLPPNYSWIEDWKIDLKWKECDADGWVYTNNDLGIDACVWSSRRRKWTRAYVADP